MAFKTRIANVNLPRRTDDVARRAASILELFQQLCIKHCKCVFSFAAHSLVFLFNAKSEGRRTTVLGLEWGMIIQVSKIIFPDENSGVRCQYYKGSDKI